MGFRGIYRICSDIKGFHFNGISGIQGFSRGFQVLKVLIQSTSSDTMGYKVIKGSKFNSRDF